MPSRLLELMRSDVRKVAVVKRAEGTALLSWLPCSQSSSSIGGEGREGGMAPDSWLLLRRIERRAVREEEKRAGGMGPERALRAMERLARDEKVDREEGIVPVKVQLESSRTWGDEEQRTRHHPVLHHHLS